MAGGHGWDALPPPPWGRDGGGAPWLTAVAGSLPPVPSRAGPCVPCGPATRPAPAASKRERRPGMSSSLQRPTTSPRVSAGGRRAVCVQGNIYVWGASLHGVGWGRGQGVEGQSAGGTLGEIHGGGGERVSMGQGSVGEAVWLCGGWQYMGLWAVEGWMLHAFPALHANAPVHEVQGPLVWGSCGPGTLGCVFWGYLGGVSPRSHPPCAPQGWPHTAALQREQVGGSGTCSARGVGPTSSPARRGTASETCTSLVRVGGPHFPPATAPLLPFLCQALGPLPQAHPAPN